MTDLPIPLTDADRRELDHVLSALRQKGFHAESWSSLLEKWRSFVRDVGEGYDLTIYDFTNDLSVRDLIEAVLEQVPASLANKLATEIAGLDAGFKSASRAISRPLLPGADKAAWWWSRVPSRPAGELLEDLKQEGLVGD